MNNGRKFTGRWEFDKIVGFGSILHLTKSQPPSMPKSFWWWCGILLNPISQGGGVSDTPPLTEMIIAS